MGIIETAIPEVKLLPVQRHQDERGWLAETWTQARLNSNGIKAAFVQENYAHSRKAGTLRGLHYQIPPATQGKLIRVVRGTIFDVAVDLRHGSPSFGLHVGVELSADDDLQIWVPPGFAHGFLT